MRAWLTTTTLAAAHALVRPAVRSRVFFRPLSASAAPTAAGEDLDVATTTEVRRVPVTLLSGFLGAGKTTLLRHVLKDAQAENWKVGVVVNDMASVNIDSKLVRSPFQEEEEEEKKEEEEAGTRAEFVELGAGCICCTIADELFTTLSQLSAVSTYKGFRYDHIVVEATGVAEPRLIRDQFQDAEADGASWACF